MTPDDARRPPGPDSGSRNGSDVYDGPAEEGDPRSLLLELATTVAGIGTFDWDLPTGTLNWDDRLLELFGYDTDTFDRTMDAFYARLHPDDLARITDLLQHSIDTCSDFDAEYRIVHPDGGTRWVVARGRTLCAEDGTAVRLLGAAWDVTARREVQARNERAARRERLLSRITEELLGTLDPDEAVAHLTRLVVPTLADWCLVTLLDDDRPAGSRRRLRHAGSWHADPDLRPLVETFGQQQLAALTGDAMLTHVMDTGEPRVVPAAASAAAEDMLHPGRARDLAVWLAPEALAMLPLNGRRGPVGVLSLLNGAERGAFTEEDMTTARHVAARAGLLLDNGRLYRQQTAVAETLQRSLLTAPPEPDHLHVVVRYVPAAEAAAVGGDWYDAFLQPGGATMLVIGDVVGHDLDAAAAMGQIRTIVRTICAEDDHAPAEALRRADRVMHNLHVPTAATAAVARLEQTEEELRRGVTRVRWSNAGHPPPMVLLPDGRVVPLLADGHDLLLGVDPDTRRRESVATIDRGSVVLLYTDGLVERRDQPLDVGLERLQQTFAELGGLGLDDLCDQLLARLLPDRPEDDVAIVAVRLNPQDRPRPVEAGPNQAAPA